MTIGTVRTVISGVNIQGVTDRQVAALYRKAADDIEKNG